MEGDLRDAGAALRASGLVAATFAPKDALGVINSSAFSLAQASHVAVACRGVLAASILAAVANADAFGVNPRVYLPEVHALRPLPHAVQIASMIGHLLEGSWVVDAHTGPQQAISFRTLVPQLASVVGAIERFACAIETEINGVGDNPVVLIDPHVMVSSSHFHTIDLALHGDALSLALYHWTEACVQRVQRTINHRSDELPSLLAHGNAAATGMNPLQKTLGYLRGRMRHLANPASLDGLVVSDQVEDLASQLPLVIDKLDQQVDVLERVLAIEALVAMQCHALRSTHERGHASQVLGAVLEGLAVPFGDGVPLGPELDRMHERLGVVVARALEEVTVCWPTSPLIGSRHSS
jgi:histidine ammonia-lyase